MNKFAGFLGVLAMVAVAPLARADFEITVNGATCTAVPGPNPFPSGSPNGSLTCPTTTVGTVTITDLAVTGLQSAAFSQQLGTTLLIQNTGGTAVTLTIDIFDTNFTSPTTPPNIADASGATLNNTTGTNQFQLTSCVNQSNTLAFCPPGTPAPGEAPANPNLMQTGPGTTSNETNGSISALHSPFALVQQLTIIAGAGSDFNVTSSQVLSPVPEPAAIVFMGTAVLGLCGLFRRKHSKRA